MKTIKLLTMVFFFLEMTSCTTNYRMVTSIRKDGKVNREVWAFGDSAFMAGNLTKNPFLFSIDSGWKLTKMDSVVNFNFFGTNDRLNVKVDKTIKPVGDFAFFSGVKEYLRPLVVPKEKLETQFRWFYTYYTFTCKYSEIQDKGPVPLNNYLTQEQCKLLFQGDMNACEGMNGLELSENLNDLKDKFQRWYYKSQYEISCEVIKHFMVLEKDTAFLSRFEKEREQVFKPYISNESNDDFEPEYVCNIFDTVFHTKNFSELYKRQSKQMSHLFSEKCKTINMFNYAFKYELVMPGTLLSANTQLRDSASVVWKVDAYRILANDYVLTAQSRTVNIWAFIVTGLLILFTAYCLLRGRFMK